MSAMTNCVYTLEGEINHRLAESILDVRGALAMFNGADFTFRLNSPGGEMFSALRIHAYLKRYPGKIRVEIGPIAMGAASFLAMAGTEIVAHPTSLFHIAMPKMSVDGNAKELRAGAKQLQTMADMMAEAYAARTGLSVRQIVKMMERETWMTAHVALANGFVTEIAEVAA